MTTSARRRLPRRSTLASVAGLACLAGALTACGGNADGSNGSGGSYESKLVSSGSLTYCADISSPPLTFYDKDQKAIGAEVELGDAIAAKMNLKPVWKNVAFAGIIPALQAHQCDAILSQLYIKPEREKVVDFVPYMYAGNTVLVKAGNPKGITGVDNLCGHKVAVETGTTAADVLAQQSAACQKNGDDPINVAQFNHDTEAQQQLKIGLVDGYGTTVETAGYAMTSQPGAFTTAGDPFGKVQTGIATTKDDSQLHDAIAKALAAVHADGDYDAILKKWQLSADALEAK
jgi:polar amino acid transport system substrate-binding protein